jgi:hypothetical protein
MYWIRGERPIPAYLLPRICTLLNNYEALDCLESESGRVAFKIPEPHLTSEKELLAVSHLIREVGEALESVAETIADGTIGVRPSTPSWRTLAAAGTSAALAIAVAPYIRTIEPAKVIEDPAMMLVFVGFIVTVTLIVRRSAYRPPQANYLRRAWTTWYAGWIHAKPKTVVRGDYERRYTPRGTRFAPPQQGTVISTQPPLRAAVPIPAYPGSDVYAGSGTTS